MPAWDQNSDSLRAQSQNGPNSTHLAVLTERVSDWQNMITLPLEKNHYIIQYNFHQLYRMIHSPWAHLSIDPWTHLSIDLNIEHHEHVNMMLTCSEEFKMLYTSTYDGGPMLRESLTCWFFSCSVTDRDGARIVTDRENSHWANRCVDLTNSFHNRQECVPCNPKQLTSTRGVRWWYRQLGLYRSPDICLRLGLLLPFVRLIYKPISTFPSYPCLLIWNESCGPNSRMHALGDMCCSARIRQP